MKYTFIHLSDLHLRTNWPEEIDLVSTKFLDDLRSQASGLENPYLVFSGDLVFSGADAPLYAALHDRFDHALRELGLTKDKRICVPGNHDVSRIAIKPSLAIQRGAINELKDERTFNDSFPQLTHLLGNKLENYVAAEKNFAEYTCCNSGLGGAGWELAGGLGLYCLNTAICSFAGMEDNQGKPISDKGNLAIHTRSLYEWIQQTSFNNRILVMHHPTDWLVDWAGSELEKIIANSFQLVFSGHVHAQSAIYSSQGDRGSVRVVAPPLFTRKSEILGYSFVVLDTGAGLIDVHYRQWTTGHKFVSGTALSNSDSGVKSFSLSAPRPLEILDVPATCAGKTDTILQREFDEAIISYSSKRLIWVDRDLASVPETAVSREDAPLSSPKTLAAEPRACIIRAPKQFGLTCLGRYIALEHFKRCDGTGVLVMIKSDDVPAHPRGVAEFIRERLSELCVVQSRVRGFILDNWQNDKPRRRVLREIKEKFPSLPIIILQGNDDCREIENALQTEDIAGFETLYLWALSRTRIRELVVSYVSENDRLDDAQVTKKLIEDIDGLNIHRTPINCLLILKLLEQSFDDSPVNRTEMIGRVLYLLFYQFDKIPRYAERPDLKDCEYALGYVSEQLIRSGKASFVKEEFYRMVGEYCKRQILDLDCEVLFAFLVSENILVRKGIEFEFRFSYWLYFFAAHRMHHDSAFAAYILGDGRYSAFPEIIEFYTGIDRRRTDAVERLTADLKVMNAEFLVRTGITADFSPLEHALWNPSEQSLSALKQEMSDSIAESALPIAVKDAIADIGYDRSRPYRQELAKFITQSSLRKMVETMRGAARALRNSDHVSPETKMALLQEVLCCWERVSQILLILSPILAEHRTAAFEGMGFYLDKSFEQWTTEETRLEQILCAIPFNIVRWYQTDIFSKKMGALFGKFVNNNAMAMRALLVLMLMVRQRPPGWERVIEGFIVRAKKNSFYLNQVFACLFDEFKTSFCNERTRQQLRRFAAMSLAKHQTGAKHPNIKLVEKVAKHIDSAMSENDAKNLPEKPTSTQPTSDQNEQA